MFLSVVDCITTIELNNSTWALVSIIKKCVLGQSESLHRHAHNFHCQIILVVQLQTIEVDFHLEIENEYVRHTLFTICLDFMKLYFPKKIIINIYVWNSQSYIIFFL